MRNDAQSYILTTLVAVSKYKHRRIISSCNIISFNIRRSSFDRYIGPHAVNAYRAQSKVTRSRLRMPLKIESGTYTVNPVTKKNVSKFLLWKHWRRRQAKREREKDVCKGLKNFPGILRANPQSCSDIDIVCITLACFFLLRRVTWIYNIYFHREWTINT